MKYIIATTDNAYFRWQMLVQINNFKRLGILDDLTYVVSIQKRRSAKLNHIQKTTGVRIETYKDERKSKIYASSIRPHILKKHFEKFPEEGEMFFYLDPDVLFTKTPKYGDEVYGLKSVWFISDTRSYLNSKYIKSKSDELFHKMCDVVGIDSDLVTRLDKGAGGAQYIMKNINSKYWENVEIDSENLYKLMSSTEHKYNPKHPIQSWTADMWAVLWNAWKLNTITHVDNNLSFSWATDSINNYDNHMIFHNAGVFDQKFLFHKGTFGSKHPFDGDLSHVSDKHCSIKYVEEILDTKKNYQELIKKL